MAGTTTSSIRTTKSEEDVDALLRNFNKAIDDIAALVAAGNGTGNVTVVTPTIGTTVTVAVPASVISIDGVRTLLAAQTAQAFGAIGTIPAATWGIVGYERVAAGTASFTVGAANVATGYATEALAIAALPAITAGKVRVGYLTILAGAGGWIPGTSALAGGTGGTPATTTNYYPGTGMFTSSLFLAAKIGDRSGTAIT